MQPATPQQIPDGLTEDGFLGGRLRLLQPEKGFRAGIDSVFLAAAVPCRPRESVLEAGVGPGVAALCLLARTREVQVTGIEIAPHYAAICAENARRNGMAERLRVLNADLRSRAPAGLAADPGFAHAMMNPPFFDQAKATPSPDLLKSQAHAFGPEDLTAWVKFLHARLAPKGSLTIVHRADSLGDILDSLHKRFGDIRVAPLFPRPGVAAARVLVQGIKASKAPLQLLPGTVLHGEGHGFTPEATAVLRDGAAFPLR